MIWEILRKINLPEKERRKEIKNILKNSNWQIYDDGYLLIYNNSDDKINKVFLISCHIDTVFDDKDFFVRKEEKKIIGTLDNSGSLAILLKAMLENKLANNVYVSFTTDEEGSCGGAHKTVRFLKDNALLNRLSLVIVMDISANADFKCDVSLENYYLNKEELKKMENILKKSKIKYYKIPVGEALPDESGTYYQYKLKVFTLCLPVKVECEENEECQTDLCYDGSLKEHCIKGAITTERKMEKVKEALVKIINGLSENNWKEKDI